MMSFVSNIKVTEMWNNHLKRIVAKKTEISELDSILGKKDDDDGDNEMIGKFGNFLILVIFQIASFTLE